MRSAIPSDGDFGPGSLLVMQGVDGVEQGRLVSGIETEEEPDEAGKAEGQKDGQRGNDSRPSGQGRKDAIAARRRSMTWVACSLASIIWVRFD